VFENTFPATHLPQSRSLASDSNLFAPGSFLARWFQVTTYKNEEIPMTGVLASQQIEQLISSGTLGADQPFVDGQVQPASLDLRLGTVAYRVRASFLAGEGASVQDRLAEFEMHRIDLTNGAVLEKGCVYVVPLLEHLSLPQDIHAIANAKSSTGRLDLLTRVIVDGGKEFDRIPTGYNGQLYAEICPRSFSVLVRPGMRLNQIRFRQGRSVLDDSELTALHDQQQLVTGGPAVIGEGLGFSVDLQPGETGLVGYRAKPHTGLIDLDRIGAYAPEDFWDPLYTDQGRLILDPGAFYILVSREAVHIPPGYAAEMAPYLAMVGEFRVHYAGFFDPGFGHAQAGGSGARGVLEVRCHEAPFVLEHGQVVGRLVYERMSEIPTQLYGAGIASNYQGQGLKLSKHFR
jgi:dCTP deaminase